MFWKLCQHRKYHALAEPPCNRLESHGLPNSAPGDSVVLREAQLNSGLSAKKSYHATIAIADGDLASGLSFKLDMLEVQIILGFPKILQSPCKRSMYTTIPICIERGFWASCKSVREGSPCSVHNMMVWCNSSSSALC